MSAIYFALLQYFVSIAFGAANLPALRECLINYGISNTVTDEDYVVTPKDDYLTRLPLCITTVTVASSCDMDEKVDRFKDLFICLNTHNHGDTIQHHSSNVILWSGKEGKQRAREQIKHAKDKDTFTIPRFGWEGKVPKTATKGKYTDKDVPVMEAYYDTMIRQIRVRGETKRQFIDLALMWLIFNSNVKTHGNKVDQYSSLKGYETWKKRGEERPSPNAGKPSLIKAGITKALIINNYFWSIEMPTVARLFSQTSYSGSIHSRSGAKLKTHLRTYIINDDGTVVGNAWDTQNIFGSIHSLRNIPVIFEKNNINYPIYKGGPEDKPTPCNLRDLITIYNNGGSDGDRITTKLHMDIGKLIQFVHWTENFKFKIFDAENHVLGAWAYDRSFAPDDVPAVFAHSQPYNVDNQLQGSMIHPHGGYTHAAEEIMEEDNILNIESDDNYEEIGGDLQGIYDDYLEENEGELQEIDGYLEMNEFETRAYDKEWNIDEEWDEISTLYSSKGDVIRRKCLQIWGGKLCLCQFLSWLDNDYVDQRKYHCIYHENEEGIEHREYENIPVHHIQIHNFHHFEEKPEEPHDHDVEVSGHLKEMHKDEAHIEDDMLYDDYDYDDEDIEAFLDIALDQMYDVAFSKGYKMGIKRATYDVIK
eukprot:471213_1